VNCCTSARLVLTTLALAGVSVGATAGALGSTSRGTVSISITVPPHVRVIPAQVPKSSNAHDLCLETNGLQGYHVALLGPAGSSQSFASPPGNAAPLPTSNLAECGASGGSNHQIGLELVHGLAAAASPGSPPLTLLIVPD
jgi:hypothetical protein